MTSTSVATYVTAYYQVKSKHTQTLYEKLWMPGLLRQPVPMVIYSEEKTIPFLKRHRKPHEAITVFIAKAYEDFDTAHYDWEEQLRLDACREERRLGYGKELLMVWNQKAAFVAQAVRENSFSSEYFFWIDFGFFRYPWIVPLLSPILQPKRLQTLFSRIGDKVFFVRRTNFKRMIPPPTVLPPIFGKPGFPATLFVTQTCAGFLGGTKQAWLTWARLYYQMVAAFSKKHYFFGSEQIVMTAMAFMHPRCMHVIEPKQWLYKDEYYERYYGLHLTLGRLQRILYTLLAAMHALHARHRHIRIVRWCRQKIEKNPTLRKLFRK